MEETLHLIDIIRERTGDRYFLMRHGDATYAIPDGDQLPDFCYQLIDEPQRVKATAQRMVDVALEDAPKLVK